VRVGMHARPVVLDPTRAPLLDIDPWLGGLLALAAIAVTLLVANFTYRWIESPLRDWSKRAWAPSRRAAAVSASIEAKGVQDEVRRY
jgi:peptidoglycan/LPS O-acetylase OafA/YrhL